MSFAHKEAKNGRAESISDEGEEEELALPSSTQKGAQSATPIVGSGPNDDAAVNEEEDQSANEDHSIPLDGTEKHGDKPTGPNGQGVLSAAVERPSSADGSLSIPDDTPSLQACITLGFLVD